MTELRQGDALSPETLHEQLLPDQVGPNDFNCHYPVEPPVPRFVHSSEATMANQGEEFVFGAEHVPKPLVEIGSRRRLCGFTFFGDGSPTTNVGRTGVFRLCPIDDGGIGIDVDVRWRSTPATILVVGAQMLVAIGTARGYVGHAKNPRVIRVCALVGVFIKCRNVSITSTSSEFRADAAECDVRVLTW